jgi:hypothetical protein
MNGFQRHGIAHLSASSINTFAAEPAIWIMERLLKKRGPVGCSAHRGTAGEAGIVHGLLDPKAEVAECQAIALAEYDRLTALSGDPKRAKEREALPGIVATGLAELRQYGVPDEVQKRIEVTLPDVPVPFLGFCDLGWSHASIVLDLKTQLRLSSEISSSHARQVALYMRATNWEGRVCYTTPSRVGVYRVEDAAQQIATITNIANRLERFLSISDDPHALAGVVVPDFDSFWWSDPTARAMGREVYGF